jgi:hypothetical protein
MLKPPFRLYKYRSLGSRDSDNDKFDHVGDILHNGRFYAALSTELGDPMEGLFTAQDGADKERLEGICDCKQGLRVCSFSKTGDNPFLWVNYAEGCRGICIEVEVDHMPDNQSGFELAEVKYPTKRPYLSREIGGRCDNHEFARKALTRKWREWKVEKEIRILSQHAYVPITPPMKMTRILLGHRITAESRTAIEQLTPDSVEIWTTRVTPIRKMDLIERYE